MDDVKMNFWGEKEAKRLFQKLPLYNALIEKPCIKCLRNIDLLHKVLVYNKLSIKQV